MGGRPPSLQAPTSRPCPPSLPFCVLRCCQKPVGQAWSPLICSVTIRCQTARQHPQGGTVCPRRGGPPAVSPGPGCDLTAWPFSSSPCRPAFSPSPRKPHPPPSPVPGLVLPHSPSLALPPAPQLLWGLHPISTHPWRPGPDRPQLRGTRPSRRFLSWLSSNPILSGLPHTDPRGQFPLGPVGLGAQPEEGTQ